MLNSEIAAICYAEKIFNECEKKNQFWDDPDFGPTPSDPKGAFSCYYTGETPPQHADVDEIKWMRPQEYLRDESDKDQNLEIGFVKNDCSSNEVK